MHIYSSLRVKITNWIQIICQILWCKLHFLNLLIATEFFIFYITPPSLCARPRRGSDPCRFTDQKGVIKWRVKTPLSYSLPSPASLTITNNRHSRIMLLLDDICWGFVIYCDIIHMMAPLNLSLAGFCGGWKPKVNDTAIDQWLKRAVWKLLMLSLMYLHF